MNGTVPGLDLGGFGAGTLFPQRTAGASAAPAVSVHAGGGASVGLPTGSTAAYLLGGLVVALVLLHVAYRRWL